MSLSNTIQVITGINECATLFQWVKSAISSLRSRWSGTEEQKIQEKTLQLQSDLQCLRDILPTMYDLIDRAEWRCHEHCVAELLPKLKDAVYDADDLLDEFRWYEQKVTVEGNASHSHSIDFFESVIQGSFNKLNDIQKRIKYLSTQLEKMGLREATPRFDKSIRPETTSFPTEPKIYGREKELKEVMELLGVPANSSRAGSKRRRAGNAVIASTSNQCSTTLDNNNKARIASIPVLPIVGIGGVGKTTLAQNICNHPRVKSHFNLIIWICVSDDFDVKRLTKEAIQSSSGKEATTDQLDSLQHALVDKVNKKRFLLILDDLWDDVLKENGQRWNKFCSPFTNYIQGSVMLVTTRSPKVSDGVRTMDPFPLEGLEDVIFWDFFNLCAFGSESSDIDPELERIGRRILPKLKGSPLAAKTLGRLLRMNLHTTHWNNILKSELWELRQEETEILPALRLSYMYLPFHLKRCFSLCAVYPKDHKFEKGSLAEIWVAEGFVEPEGDIQILDIGCQYFEDLVNRSFFQIVRGAYVIHDLLHDMAQLVSKHDCFILKNRSDFQKVPQNVRHLSILSSTKVDCSDLLGLCKHTKLRTLLCNKSLGNTTLASVMDRWCSELPRVRVIFCASTKELPESIGNLKHLRYLEISRAVPFKSLPSAFCYLYNLQILYARECKIESLPRDFGKLVNLQRFESWGFRYHQKCPLNFDAADGQGPGIRLIKNMNQICGDLKIHNLGAISMDQAAEVQLKKKKYLDRVELQWHLRSPEQNEIEVLQVLQPPTSLKSLFLLGYPGAPLPRWFQPQNLPSLTSLSFEDCHGIEGISFSDISQHIDLNETPAMLVDNIGILSSLTYLTISGCQNLSSLQQLLRPAYVPAIKKITILRCEKLVSLPTEKFGDLRCLEELEVCDCPVINSKCLEAPSLKKLRLGNSGNLVDNIKCSSLTFFALSCPRLTSIQLQLWSLPALQILKITACDSLTFIGEFASGFPNLARHGGNSSIRTFSSLTELSVDRCNKLSTLDDLLALEYVPAIEKIYVKHCAELQSLPGERFGTFPFLKDLDIRDCPNLDWRSGLVLPSSLERLYFDDCGDTSACFPSCLESLTSLVSLKMNSCAGLESIPRHLWSNLASLQELCLRNCPDLVSIGGAEAIAKIKNVSIHGCPKLTQPKQPVRRGGI